MSQHICSNLQKSYLEIHKSYGDDPYIVENLMKSSTTFVYNVFTDYDVKFTEYRKYQNCPDF